MRKKNDQEKEISKTLLIAGQALALASTITFQIAVPILLGAFGGRYLDERLNTQPWLMISGIFLGLAAGVVGMVRIVQRFFDKK
jgi:F0F1-type ATP synthase assembly protein I